MIEPYLAAPAEAIERRYRARTPRSAEAWERARARLPGGVNRNTVYYPPYPIFLERGEGCRVADFDRNSYVDFNNNYGSLALGHAHPRVMAAAQEALLRGASFGSPTELEAELAGLILERVPWAGGVRFCTSGTEATMFALRLARQATGRPLIAKMVGSYHGLSDSVMVPPGADPRRPVVAEGIPGAVAGTVAHLPFNDPEAACERLRELGQAVAAVIVEPVLGAGGMIPATPAFLQALRQATEAIGALLIVDEVITFRLHPGGLHQALGVTPDLMAVGKLIGGGLPVGAVVGRDVVMGLLDPTRPGAMYHSGTFAGSPATLAAGIATLETFTPGLMAELNARGDRLRERLTDLFRRKGLPMQVTGHGSVFQVHVRETPVTTSPTAEEKARFFPLFLGLLNEGVMVTQRGSGCLSTPMSEAEADSLVEGLELLC